MQETHATLAQAPAFRPGIHPPASIDTAIIAARLKRFRRARKLTLQAVAELVGTTPQTVQRLESGGMTLSVDWVLKLCRVYETDPARLFEAGGDHDPRVVAKLGESRRLTFARSDHQEAVALATPAQGVFGVRLGIAIGDFEAGDILLACPADPLSPGNRDWGTCLVSIANEPAALRQVFETAGGQWIITGLDRGDPAEFTGSVAWLARIITVVRHMPDIRDAPEMENADAVEACE